MTAEILNMTTPSIKLESSGCDRRTRRLIDLSVGILTALLNLAEIIIILKMRRKKKVYEIVLISLSVSDFMFGLSNGFVFIFNALLECRYQDILEGVYTLYVFFVMTSILHLLFIALDRLLAVLRPIKYKAFSTRKRAYMSLASLWILAILASALLRIIYEFTDKFQERNKNLQMQSQNFHAVQVTNSSTSVSSIAKKSPVRPPGFVTVAQFTLSVAIVIADILIFIFYSLIIYCTSSKTIKSNKTMNKKLPIICMAIGATFIFLTFPYVVARLTLGSAPFWANLTLLMNSGMNSVVYFFRGKLEVYQQARSVKPTYINK